MTCLGQLQAGANNLFQGGIAICEQIHSAVTPTGRIIQDGGYYKSCSSINASYSDTGRRYDSVMKLVLALDGVSLYIKADLLTVSGSLVHILETDASKLSQWYELT